MQPPYTCRRYIHVRERETGKKDTQRHMTCVGETHVRETERERERDARDRERERDVRKKESCTC
jgi:hypothetical protein